MSLFGKLSQVFDSGKYQAGSKPARPVAPKVKPVQPQVEKPQQVQPKVVPQQPRVAPQPQINTDHLVREAQAKAREVIVEAKGEVLRMREEAEQEVRRIRQSLDDQQRSLDQKLNNLEKRLNLLDQKEEHLEKLKQELDQANVDVRSKREKALAKLEEISKMTKDEAREFLLDTMEKRLSKEMSLMVRQKEEEARNQADELAKEIIVDSMKHGATDYVPEYTLSVVKIPDEEVKGRIIGKAGRNIHAFERATGVDVDLDGDPNEVR